MLLSGSSAGAPPSEPLPSRPGPPAPPPPGSPLPRSGQWPRRLDTPSPRPASRFICQTKRDQRQGSGGGYGNSAPQGRPGWRRRDADPAALTRGPGAPVWGWALGGLGSGPTRQDQARAAAPAGPASTHSPGSHIPRRRCAYTEYTHRCAHPAHRRQTQTHTAHTLMCTSQMPHMLPAHSDTHRHRSKGMRTASSHM